VLRALVAAMDERSDRNAAREKHFADMPAGLSLPAA